MATPNISDEALMAYADGMMTPAEAKEISRLIAADPALQRRVEMFRQSAVAVNKAMAPLVDEPVPDALNAAVASMVRNTNAGPNVVAFKPRGAAETPRRFGQMAIAASLAAVIGGFAGYGLRDSGRQSFEIAVGQSVPQNLATVLSVAPSGSENAVNGHTVKLISTFRVGGNDLCREFEAGGGSEGAVVAVACREKQSWNTRFAVAAVPAADGYAPASSYEAVEAFLDAVGAGAALGVDEEKTSLSVD
jgi:surface antigen